MGLMNPVPCVCVCVCVFQHVFGTDAVVYKCTFVNTCHNSCEEVLAERSLNMGIVFPGKGVWEAIL